jgi:hypothetical protein
VRTESEEKKLGTFFPREKVEEEKCWPGRTEEEAELYFATSVTGTIKSQFSFLLPLKVFFIKKLWSKLVREGGNIKASLFLRTRHKKNNNFRRDCFLGGGSGEERFVLFIIIYVLTFLLSLLLFSLLLFMY